MRIRARQLALSLLTALATLPLAFLQAQAAPPASPPGPVLITAAAVWTGEGVSRRGWAVLVSKCRIDAAGPLELLSIPANAERIDLERWRGVQAPVMTFVPSVCLRLRPPVHGTRSRNITRYRIDISASKI